VNGSQVVVAQQDGLYVTVNTSSLTTYQENGQSVPASEVQAGRVVSVSGTVSSDHTQIDATTIEIVLPSVAGRVTAVSGTTITITGLSGTAETVTTVSSTVFRNQSRTTTIASVTKGDFVQAFGAPSSDDSFAAVSVYIGASTSVGPFLPGGTGGPVPFGPMRPGGPPATGDLSGSASGYGWGASGYAGGARTSVGGASASASTPL
jgi:hypothetical protein